MLSGRSHRPSRPSGGGCLAFASTVKPRPATPGDTRRGSRAGDASTVCGCRVCIRRNRAGKLGAERSSIASPDQRRRRCREPTGRDDCCPLSRQGGAKWGLHCGGCRHRCSKRASVRGLIPLVVRPPGRVWRGGNGDALPGRLPPGRCVTARAAENRWPSAVARWARRS